MDHAGADPSPILPIERILLRATTIADARKELHKDILQPLLDLASYEAGSSSSAGQTPRIVALKGFGSGLVEYAKPFRQRVADKLQELKANVIICDGDWLKAQSFSSCIPPFLASDAGRVSIHFRKAVDGWDEPSHEQSKKLDKMVETWTLHPDGGTKGVPDGELRRQYKGKGVNPEPPPAPLTPGSAKRSRIVLVSAELVVEAKRELRLSGCPQKLLDDTTLGFLTVLLSGCEHVLCVGGGPTTKSEAEVWLDRQFDAPPIDTEEACSLPQWHALQVERWSKGKWEDSEPVVKAVNGYVDGYTLQPKPLQWETPRVGTTASPLHACAKRSNVRELRLLLEAGLKADTPHFPNIDGPDEEGHSALYVAVLYQRIGAVKELLKARADPNFVFTESQKPTLTLAAEMGDAAIVDVLLASKADPSTTGRYQSTALHMAARKGHPDVIRTILDSNMSERELDGGWDKLLLLNDEDGLTPLQIAACYNQPHVVAEIAITTLEDGHNVEHPLDWDLRIEVHRAWRRLWPEMQAGARLVMIAAGVSVTEEEEKGMSSHTLRRGQRLAQMLQDELRLLPTDARCTSAIESAIRCLHLGWSGAVAIWRESDRQRGRSTKGRDAASEILLMAVSLSTWASDVAGMLRISNTRASNQLSQCASRAQLVAAKLLELLEDEDIGAILYGEIGQLAIWQITFSHQKLLLARSSLQAFMTTDLLGGRTSLLAVALSKSGVAADGFHIEKLPEEMVRRVRWFYLPLGLALNGVLLLMSPVIALCPPLEEALRVALRIPIEHAPEQRMVGAHRYLKRRSPNEIVVTLYM